jgi:uncharacterized membrane protein YccC
MAGMSLILTSVVFFFVEDDFRRILGVTAGLFMLLLAIWYAAHPFLREERIYRELRRDVDKFIDLTRQLHYASIRGDHAAIESIEERIPQQVEIVIGTARKSRASPNLSHAPTLISDRADRSKSEGPAALI